MCLVLVAWRQLDDWPLIVAGNRDEFHARPTEPLHWWPDAPDVLAGRDLQAGGTWLALGRSGRIATVTNFRDAVPPKAGRRSRGKLVTDFIEGRMSPLEYVESIDGDAYSGFNLFVSDGDTLAFANNRDGAPRLLEPGVYGLANATLDAPWHKTLVSKERLGELLEAGTVNSSLLLRLLDDRELGPAHDVSTDGLEFRRAHALTAPFIVQPDYGTRSSTIVLRDSSGAIEVTERRFEPDGRLAGESRKSFVSGVDPE